MEQNGTEQFGIDRNVFVVVIGLRIFIRARVIIWIKVNLNTINVDSGTGLNNLNEYRSNDRFNFLKTITVNSGLG